MRAMRLERCVGLGEGMEPLRLVELPDPEPGPGEVRIRVAACGVCHTEIDEIEGRTRPRLPVVPGHQVVGHVDRLGSGVIGHALGDRVGVGWIYSSSGADDENLSPEFRATGRDVDGGYAEYLTVPAAYAYPIPGVFSDEQAAPLLCAGAVGYRALRLAGLRDGGLLGLTGFGGSAHLVLQLARHLYPNTPVHVFARSEPARNFARRLGAAWTGGTADRAPELLHAIIDTTPAWMPVVEALANLRPGGRLVINAIRKEDADRDCLLGLSYAEHLWMEKEIRSVANVTRRDIAEFLPIAARIPIIPEVQAHPLEEANQAILALKRGGVRGAKVLVPRA
ncbi:MAG: alcohol dehydrogenase catalytic domain-containing protein [Acidobacteriota bacterium]